MQYVYKNEDINYFYDVTYNENKLREILNKLKKYSYTCFSENQISGDITKFPATRQKIYFRLISLFSNLDKNIYKNSVIHHTENNCDYVTYQYSYDKLTDLYYCIDILINEKDITRYPSLLPNNNKNVLYVYAHQEQYLLEALLNYINSYELIDINAENSKIDKFNNNFYQDFDYE